VFQSGGGNGPGPEDNQQSEVLSPSSVQSETTSAGNDTTLPNGEQNRRAWEIYAADSCTRASLRNWGNV
jgi:hypothetical protein